MLPQVNLIRGTTADYLLFATDDAISSTIYRNGSWAAPLVTISSFFYSDLPEPFVIDIGANLGAYSLPVAKELAAAGGFVYAYEPQRIIFYQLCGNVFVNRLDNVFTHCMALGDHDGTVQIPAIDYQKSTNIGGFSVDASIREHQACITTRAGRPEPEVPLARLDSLTLPKAPCLIKIDVEGLELQVLQGAAGTLARYNYPPLMLEAWTGDWFAPERQKLLDYIAQLGYATFTIGDELICQHPQHGRQIAFSTDAQGTIHIGRIR